MRLLYIKHLKNYTDSYTQKATLLFLHVNDMSVCVQPQAPTEIAELACHYIKEFEEFKQKYSKYTQLCVFN